MRYPWVAGAGSVLLIVLGGCGSDVTTPGQEAAAGNAPALTREEPADANTSAATRPTERRTVKSRVRIKLDLHCGVRSVIVDGVLWLADPPRGGHNPPRGWDENRAVGSFSVLTKRRAEFRGDGGEFARFRRARPAATDPADGCE